MEEEKILCFFASVLFIIVKGLAKSNVRVSLRKIENNFELKGSITSQVLQYLRPHLCVASHFHIHPPHEANVITVKSKAHSLHIPA